MVTKTINGNTYDFSADFDNYGFRTKFPLLIDDILVVCEDASTSAIEARTAGGLTYTFDEDTTATDPGTGKLKFNHATLSSATALYISETTNAAINASGALATWDDGTSTVRGTLKVTKQTNAAVFAQFNITGTITDGGTWDTFTVAYVTGNGVLADGDLLVVQFVAKGDKGDTGATGSAGTGFTREFMTSTGSGGAYVLTPAVALSAYVDGQVFNFEANHASPGASTLNIMGPSGLLGAKDIRKNFDQPLEVNDIKTNFSLIVQYEASNDRFLMLTHVGQILTNPKIRGWNREIVSRGTIANSTADEIAIVFNTSTRLHNIKTKLSAGTVTINLKKNGSAITFGAGPAANVSVTTSLTTVAVNNSSLAYIDFAPGDTLHITRASASSASHLTVGLDTTENY